MPRSLLALALVCAVLGTVGSPSVAHGEPEQDGSAIDTARADFAEGQSQYRAKKWGDALKSFERSFQVVASPNAELMIARCQRELGRAADAATTFANTEAEAKRRVARGEGKYADTATAAATEGSAVRKDLGQLKIHVAHADGASLYVDKKAVALSRDGDATVFHEPGSAIVQVMDGVGNERHQTADVTAGQSTEVTLRGPAKTKETTDETALPNPKKDEATKAWPGWFLPATIAAGGTTVLAGGLAVGFGLSSQSTYKTIYLACGPSHCGAAQRDAADSGARAQTIANVSYVVAAVGLVATAVIVYFGLKTSGIISGPL